MKALREAKACLADTVAMTHTADRLKTALAALVEAVEAAPVGRVYDLGVGEARISSEGSEFYADMAGQRVRVLAVGEESNG